MVEYGNGVSQVAGQAGGGAGTGGRSMDVGASVGQFVTDSAHTISTMPPVALALLAVVILVLGALVLKRVL
jgi:hypothetical protein